MYKDDIKILQGALENTRLNTHVRNLSNGVNQIDTLYTSSTNAGPTAESRKDLINSLKKLHEQKKTVKKQNKGLRRHNHDLQRILNDFMALRRIEKKKLSIIAEKFDGKIKKLFDEKNDKIRKLEKSAKELQASYVKLSTSHTDTIYENHNLRALVKKDSPYIFEKHFEEITPKTTNAQISELLKKQNLEIKDQIQQLNNKKVELKLQLSANLKTLI